MAGRGFCASIACSVDGASTARAAVGSEQSCLLARNARAHLATASGDDEQAHALAQDTPARHELPFGLRTASLFDAKHGRLAEADRHLSELENQLLREDCVLLWRDL
jgi:hypothetical protein